MIFRYETLKNLWICFGAVLEWTAVPFFLSDGVEGMWRGEIVRLEGA